MNISDERLAELVIDLQQHLRHALNTGQDTYLPFESDSLAALIELQEWRRHNHDCPSCGKIRTSSIYLCQCPLSPPSPPL